MPKENNYPLLHNAMWPGLVGKGPESEPFIDLDTMLDFTANAQVDGLGFDGVDLFLAEPHTPIDADTSTIEKLAEKLRGRGLVAGSCVAPVWESSGGGSAMGNAREQQAFLDSVRNACRIASKLRDLGVRPTGVVRIDSSCSVSDWAKDPLVNTKRIANTFRLACDIATDYGERLAAEGEICWGGMHSWQAMLDTLEATDREGVIGFQADMAHTLLYFEGFNAPEHRILAENRTLEDPDALNEAISTLAMALRPWTIDFHIAQNDGTVKGQGTHDKTGRHCLPDDPDGKLNIPEHAGAWLRDEDGSLTKAFNHICWDGCMFANSQLMNPATWESVLRVMLQVRERHGWCV